jgi:peptidoglycan/LPS O-acetylase OafA/YrhL
MGRHLPPLHDRRDNSQRHRKRAGHRLTQSTIKIQEGDQRTGEPATFTFAAINGWRGVGSVGIAVAHLEVISDFFGVQYIRPIIFLVDLFFVASGVIIAQAYSRRLRSGAAVLDYAVRRFGRIWPLHVVLLAILVAYECLKLILQQSAGRHFFVAPFAVDGGTDPWAILTNSLLVHSLGFHGRETWNFPSWSLSVEFVIYFVFAFFCLAGVRWCRVLSVLALFGSLVILICFAPVGMRSTFDYGVFRCAIGFFTGTLAYEIAATRRFPQWPWPTIVEVGVLCGAIVWMFFAEGSRLAFAAPVIFFVLIVVFILERGALSRWFRQYWLQALAELSYAIYIVHAVVLMGFMAAVRAAAAHFHWNIFIATPPEFVPAGLAPATLQLLHFGNRPLEGLVIGLYALIVVAAAYAGHRLVEVPGRRFFNGVAKRLSNASPARPLPIMKTIDQEAPSQTPVS